MYKLLVFTGIISLLSGTIFSQTAVFRVVSDTVCYKTQTSLFVKSSKAIKPVKTEWDLNLDGTYTDAIGDTIHTTFAQRINNRVTAKVTLSDNSVLFTDTITVSLKNISEGAMIVKNLCEGTSTQLYLSFASKQTITSKSWNINNISVKIGRAHV